MTAARVSPLKPSTSQHKSVVDLDIEEYECTEWNNAKHHRLKYIHVILDVYFTVSENIKDNNIYALEHLYDFNIIKISFQFHI